MRSVRLAERRRAVSAWMESSNASHAGEGEKSPAGDGKAEGKEGKGPEQRDW